MRAPKDGTGHIQIFTAPHDCALSIPVQRRRRPELIVRPEVLLLSGVASKEGVPQSLGVTLVTKEPHQEVVVRRLVPWLTARSITRVSENALDGELRLTPSKMPRTFSGAGLEASLKEGRTKVSLVAKIAP